MIKLKIKPKCSTCHKQIKGELSYRHGKILCSKCYNLLKNDGASSKRNYWDAYLNGKSKMEKRKGSGGHWTTQSE